MEWHEIYIIAAVTILCGRHHDLVDRYGIFVSQMTTDRFHLSEALSESFFSIMTNTMGANGGAGTVTILEHMRSLPSFLLGFVLIDL
jgi:hypothetical protein